MSDKFTLDVVQAAELKYAFERNGYTNADIKEMCSGEMLGRMLPVVRGYGEVTIVKRLLDCSKPFNPTEFIGPDWKEAERDERSYALTEIDFSQVLLETCLEKNEDRITGETKLKRLKEKELIRLGGQQFLALWLDYQANKENSVLEWLRKTRGITYLDFPGLVLLYPDGSRYVLYLFWYGGQWYWDYYWLDYVWDGRHFSAALAS